MTSSNPARHPPPRCPAEREVPLPVAVRRVSATLSALGLRARLLDAGPGRDPAAWWCGLLGEADTTPVACGMGKGSREEARTGALFEAVEHYLTGPAGFDPNAVELSAPAELAAGPLREDVCEALVARMGGRRMACARYRAIGGRKPDRDGLRGRDLGGAGLDGDGPSGDRLGGDGLDGDGLNWDGFSGGDLAGDGLGGDVLDAESADGEGGALVPLFLSAPWYVEASAAPMRDLVGDHCDYADLMRYSCNSGSAVGVTVAEALLHALNEAIERDALSLLLIRAFLGGRGFRPRLIDPETLPDGPARAYAVAGEVTGSPVHLLDITSDLGVPTMLAYTRPTSRHPHRRGTGTSLSPSHAAWRALTELVQTTLGAGLPAGAHRDPSALAAHPALHACARFELGHALREARMVPFPADAAAGVPAETPGGQVRTVVTALAARGFTAYGRTVHTLPSGVAAVHVFVPGLERFMLVTDGNLVIPGRRGRAAAVFVENVSVSLPRF
ncbi:YcaO-like family protein [Nonomuraea fuscirosea]|uniref:YcaO-like family protein n=1 Tax=Nonomuraea fuscirosea TaxID=1291556 RepID=UPI0034143785